MDKQFTWLPIIKELREKVSDYENQQEDLIQVLEKAGVTNGIRDQNPKGNWIPLKEVGPFSFLSMAYKYGKKKNLEILASIKDQWQLKSPLPVDFDGIPSVNPQSTWHYPYKYERKKEDIPFQWKLFKQALKGSIEEDTFNQVLNIKLVGIVKLTQRLFHYFPEEYFPVDAQTSGFLEEHGLNSNPKDFREYMDVLKKLREMDARPFYQISHECWLSNQKVPQEVNYWIFQGNPKIYDFETGIRDNLIDLWTVSSHREKIKIGDKVILWITGNKAGCYALAEITSLPNPRVDEVHESDVLWKEDNKSEYAAGIKITHNLIDHPILKDQINSDPRLNKFKAGNQGTNFSATKDEYDAILDMIEGEDSRRYWLYAPGENARNWDQFYKDGIMALGWDDLGDLSQFSSKAEIEKALIDKYEYDNPIMASLANWEFANTIQKGDVIIAKKGRSAYLGYGIVSSNYFFQDDSSDYRSRRQVDWKKSGYWVAPKNNIVTKTLTDITKYPDYVARLRKLIGIEMETETESMISNSEIMDLNTIYYGPPGCGKTWKLQNELMPKFIERNVRTQEEFHQSLADELSWWEVISIVLLDIGSAKVSAIFNHSLLQAKAQLSSTKTPKSTIWSMLQIHTKDDCPNVNFTSRAYPQFFWKDEHSVWEIDRKIVEEETPYLLDKLEAYINFNPNDGAELKRFVFTTFHQSFAYEDFVEGIKPDLEETTDGQISYKIVPGIFKKIVERAKADPGNDYAIFIDEINRGNIAAIFGELITLIEKDKRISGRYPLEARLPYSKEDFCVPSNLYIFGTMNTADRSVEALDSALRRRFTFIEVIPDPGLIKQPVDLSIDLRLLLSAINKRIGVLLDKDHRIGHSYFMRIHEAADPVQELKLVFANKVIPLLEEYFYGDLSKIALILGEKFVTKDESISEDIFAKGDFDRPEILDAAKYQLVDVGSLDIDAFTSIYAKG